MNERILAAHHTVSNDTRRTGLNNNDLIIGPSGAGKTRGYVKPNLLRGGRESVIVADTKGTLYRELGSTLRKAGYTVIHIDLTDCLHSPWGYNPLAFIRYDQERDAYNEQDIITTAACLVPIEDKRDPFWEMAVRMVLESLIGYVLECLPQEEHNLCSVAALFREMPNPSFRRLLHELKELNPESFSVTRYEMFKVTAGAEKMYASIQGILAEKLSPFTFDGTKALFMNPKQISFAKLGKKKTVVFLHISDTDRSADKLTSLFYTQALQTLCNSADKNPNFRLDVPVRIILDDFAAGAGTCIPDFDNIISVIRSREISVSIILQSISQLEGLYGHAKAMTILNNCDHWLYLGGQDVETARYISIKANRSIHAILDMPPDRAWLFTRGSAPEQVEKYGPEPIPGSSGSTGAEKACA